MNDKGWLKLHRVLEDKSFAGKPDYLAVWIRLLMKASYKEHTIIFNDEPLVLKIGDCLLSQRKFAKCLGLDPKKMRRILSFFEKNKQVTLRTTNKFTVISITNFVKFQECPHECPIDASLMPHERPTSAYIQEGKEGEEVKNNTSTSKKSLSDKSLKQFDELYEVFNHRKGKKPASKAFAKLGNVDDVFFNKIIKGAKTTAAARPALIANKQTPKMLQGWITDELWEDEVEAGKVAAGGSLSDSNRMSREVEEARQKSERMEDEKIRKERVETEKLFDSFSLEQKKRFDEYVLIKEKRGDKYQKINIRKLMWIEQFLNDEEYKNQTTKKEG